MTDTFLSRLQFSVHVLMARLGYGLGNFKHPMRGHMWEECRRTLKEIRTSTTPLECTEIWQWLKACEQIPGDIAELGVYNGATAALMLKCSPKKIHLFDTFEGLPSSEGKFEQGEWNSSLTAVRYNLRQWLDRTQYHVGLFPASTKGVETQFSFVHLDADLYSSTKSALDWFWPRLSVGGVILSHDYPLSEGVVRAFHEFIEGRNDVLFVPLPGNNCIVSKR